MAQAAGVVMSHHAHAAAADDDDTAAAEPAINAAFHSLQAARTIPDKRRVLLMEQLARRVPPSAAAALLPSFAAALGATANIPALSPRVVQNEREEMTPISETLAALRIGRHAEGGGKIDITCAHQLCICIYKRGDTTMFDFEGSDEFPGA